jgi:hypothetical protein
VSARALPPREAAAALLLLATPVLSSTFVVPDGAGGPLAPATALALLNLALLSPSIAGESRAAWGFLGLPLASPALCAAAYGRGPHALLLCGLLALAAASGGSAARALPEPGRRAYLAFTTLLFFAPFGAGHLVAEFGEAAHAEAWRDLSPLFAAWRAQEGRAPLLALVLALLWPVGTLAWLGYLRRFS